MSDFREMMIDITKLQSDNAKTPAIQQMLDTQAEWKALVDANAKAQAKHNKLQESLQENPIYPKDRHDSDADELSRPLDWQEQQARDIEEMEK